MVGRNSYRSYVAFKQLKHGHVEVSDRDQTSNPKLRPIVSDRCGIVVSAEFPIVSDGVSDSFH